jgi:hypothetical protein
MRCIGIRSIRVASALLAVAVAIVFIARSSHFTNGSSMLTERSSVLMTASSVVASAPTRGLEPVASADPAPVAWDAEPFDSSSVVASLSRVALGIAADVSCPSTLPPPLDQP